MRVFVCVADRTLADKRKCVTVVVGEVESNEEKEFVKERQRGK